MNQLVDRALPLIVRQFAELQFCGLNDAGDGAPGQNDAVVSVAGVLLLLGLVFGGHAGRNLVSLFACPAVYLVLIHHGGDGLFFQSIVFGLELVGPQLGRFGDLPGTLQLLLGLLRPGFGLALQLPGFFLSGLGLVCTVFFL